MLPKEPERYLKIMTKMDHEADLKNKELLELFVDTNNQDFLRNMLSLNLRKYYQVIADNNIPFDIPMSPEEIVYIINNVSEYKILNNVISWDDYKRYSTKEDFKYCRIYEAINAGLLDEEFMQSYQELIKRPVYIKEFMGGEYFTRPYLMKDGIAFQYRPGHDSYYYQHKMPDDPEEVISVLILYCDGHGHALEFLKTNPQYTDLEIYFASPKPEELNQIQEYLSGPSICERNITFEDPNEKRSKYLDTYFNCFNREGRKKMIKFKRKHGPGSRHKNIHVNIVKCLRYINRLVCNLGMNTYPRDISFVFNES